MGEALDDEEREIFLELTGRAQEAGARCEEFAAVVGRRGGKTEATATTGAYIAGCCDFSDVLVPGETGTLLIIGADVQQAIIVLDRIEAKLRTSPVMKQLVKSRTQQQLRLTNGIFVQVKAPNFRRIRGPTLIACIGDEVAHWSTDEMAAKPDVAICAAVRPALATTGGPLMLISSPYAKRGELFGLWKRHYGPLGDPLILVAQGTSLKFNPSLPQSVVDRAMERDPASARAEYLAEFRSDVGAFVDRDVIVANVMTGVRELMPSNNISYRAFCDPSGGSSDSFSLCIGHLDSQRDTCVIDAIREIMAPFSPEVAVAELSVLMKIYNCTRVTGDRYGGEWPREAFSRHGITYELSALPKSGLYQCLLPLLNSGKIELLDNQRMISQLATLERRTARGGKDSIDHPVGHRDDVADAVAGLAAITVPSNGEYTLRQWVSAFNPEAGESDKPPPPRYVPADGSSVPFIPWDLRQQYERQEAAMRGRTLAPLPVAPTPEMIRAMFAKMEAERKL
jgi:hypothetical protein